MQKLKFIFPLMGVIFMVLWLVKTMSHVEAGSFKSISEAQIKYQYLALLGFAFWIYPAISWFKSGSKFNSSEILSTLKDNVYPTYGRKIPSWAHVIRLIGFAAFLYFMSGAVEVLNDELFFNWKYYFPAAFSAAIFFLTPFIFQRKTQ